MWGSAHGLPRTTHVLRSLSLDHLKKQTKCVAQLCELTELWHPMRWVKSQSSHSSPQPPGARKPDSFQFIDVVGQTVLGVSNNEAKVLDGIHS